VTTPNSDSESNLNRPNPLRTLWEWVWPIIVGVGIAWCIQRWVVGFAEVPTASMAPTIPNPCYVLVDHVATELFPIHRGEVVLFPFPDDPKQIFVKRLIGMPGDTVEIHGGKVYINGKVLNEPYLKGLYTGGKWGPYHVPMGHYFMLGDNRNISEDSRYWHNTYVAANTIIGRADFVVWPIKKVSHIVQ